MTTLSEYFNRNREPAKFEFGARVFGRLNRVPFVGSVGSDGIVSETVGPLVSVTLDLPMLIDNKYHTAIKVPRSSIKLLKFFD